MNLLHPVHPDQVAALDTGALRGRFLVSDVFRGGEASLAFTHHERLIFGGVVPLQRGLDPGPLPAPLRIPSLTANRELGVVNLGGPGRVSVGAEHHVLGRQDALYVGRGTGAPTFHSDDPDDPARFFVVSAPAQRDCPSRRIAAADQPTAVVESPASSGRRRIRRLIAPDTAETCQLVMGVTELLDGTLWSTMPSHRHQERTEVYLYFDMAADTYVVHLLGKPEETRHLVVRNEEAVVVPPGTIHSGVGTGHYALLWAMAGENRDVYDFEVCDPRTIA